MQDTTTTTPAWEQSKENAAPLERGRNVQTLERALTTEMQQERDNMVAHYEGLVRPSERSEFVEENDDPLIHWLSYIKYHQEAFSSNTHDQFLLMERCTRALSKLERYANDVRFIRVCVQYADKTAVPNDVFKYLHSIHVGTRTTLFWVAWAWVAETNQDYAFCEKIYKKALSVQAKPLKLLKQRQRQFNKRMSRLWINQASYNLEEEDEEEDEPMRNALGQLSRDGTERNDRSAYNHSDNHQTNPNLSTFSVRGHSSSSSSRPRDNRPPQHSLATSRHHKRSKSNNSNKFDIFVEKDEARGDYNFLDEKPSAQSGMRREMTREADRTKENTIQAHRWNQHGGLPLSRSASFSSNDVATAPVSRGPPPAFAIHVDEECEAQHKTKEVHKQRDERTLRQKMDGGMAEKLTRDPLRYVRHPSKLALDQQEESKQATSTNERKSNKGGITCGFSKRLLTKDSNGMEQCFEEGRARRGCFTIVGASENFNHLVADDRSMRTKLSSMSMSIDEVDMEDVQDDDGKSLAAATASYRVESSYTPAALPRKALFSHKTGIDDVNTSLSALNTSNASSTVDPNVAVGVPAKRDEETINTKLAKMELSVMFSSPAIGLASKNRIEEEQASIDNGQTASLSVIANLVNDDTNKDSESFVDHNDENQARRNPVARTNTNHPEFDQRALRTMGPAEVEQRELPEEVRGENSGLVPLDDSASYFEVDHVPLEESNVPRPAVAVGPQSMAFEIYCDEENKSNGGSSPSKDKPTQGIPFEIYHDSLDRGGDDDENGETATLSLFGDTIKELQDVSKPASPLTMDINTGETSQASHGLQPGGGDEILLDTVDFGDISRIVPDETSHSHDRVAQAAVSPTFSLGNESDALDYNVLHTDDVNTSLWQLHDKARELAGSKLSRNAPISTRMLTKKGLVYHRPSQSIPRALFRKKASASEGTEIEIGEQTGVVKQELGRGSYGVVVLLDTVGGRNNDSTDEETIAVKAQTPTDCLAWEYVMLGRVEERIMQHWSKTMHPAPFPYPRGISFVSLADGGLLGMTAGSKSGFNLVDLVNFYKSKERAPVPELIVLHYTARMLLHVETLHWHGKILHGDVKPDNFVLTASSEAYSGCEQVVDGSDLMLVDFGRAVDLVAAAKDGQDPLKVKLLGDAASRDMSCVAMRQGRAWSFDLDTFGICASAHVLLFGSHMEIEMDRKSEQWRLRKPFRRYWNKDLWNQLFGTLLNGNDKSSISSRPHSLRSLRKSFESYLQDSVQTKQLESSLKHQARILPQKK